MNTKGFYIMCFFMGVMITLLMAILHFNVVPPAHASTAGAGAQSFAVGTGMTDSEGQGVLWIIDPEKQVLAAYANDRGVGLQLIAVRKFEYDMKMLELNDQTKPKGFRVGELKRKFKKQAGGDK